MRTIVSVAMGMLLGVVGCAGQVSDKDPAAEALVVEERAPQHAAVTRAPHEMRAPEAAVAPAANPCHQGTVRDDSICKLGYGQAGDVQQLSTWWCPVDEEWGPYGNGNYAELPQSTDSCRHLLNNGSTDSVWCCN